MNPTSDVLPRALRNVSLEHGLTYLPYAPGEVGVFPVACHDLPNIPEPERMVASLPIQMNFAREEFDMDKPEDREEYNKIMTYRRAGYGMEVLHLERRFVKKKRLINGQTRCRIVQRIYIEYYAPYRVLPQHVANQHNQQNIRQLRPPDGNESH